jgi:hypothetical protein
MKAYVRADVWLYNYLTSPKAGKVPSFSVQYDTVWALVQWLSNSAAAYTS